MRWTLRLRSALGVFAALGALAMTVPAHAEPLRVLAASELRLEPSVRADRAAMTVRVWVRDDHGAPARGRVELSALPDGQRSARTFVASTDARGEASFLVEVGHDDRVFELRADFVGGEGIAPAHSSARVDLDAPFISIELRAPATVDLDGTSAEVLASISVADVVALNPRGLEVALFADDALLETASADATGRVVFRLDPSRMGPPGVRTLRAQHERAGARVRSLDRRVVVRARTALTLERASASEGMRVIGGLATRVGPVRGAPVQVFWGTQVVGAGLTNERGVFEVAVDPEIASRPDVVVRAVFAPSEPWYAPSESAPLRLTLPPPRRVPWTFAAAPVALAALILTALRLHARRAIARDRAWSMRPIGDAPVERLADAPAGITRVRIVVTDRATEATVPAARAHWRMPPLGERDVLDPVDVQSAGKFSLEVSAPGYAPRAIEGELPRGGEYALRVFVRTWREELFDRLRRWIRSTGAVTKVLPTPREYARMRGNDDAVRDLAFYVEFGTYGAEAPGPESVARADALARAAAGDPSRSVDGQN